MAHEGTLTEEQAREREQRRQKIQEAEAQRELQRRRLQKSNGQPMSGLVDTDETE